MIALCCCSPKASGELAAILGSPQVDGEVEVEFREVPSFIITRSGAQRARGNTTLTPVGIISVNSLGLLFEADELGSRSLVPWQNVISITARKEDQ